MEPITRKEKYLAKISGEDVQIPEKPITREEMYLNAIAQGSSGGDGYSKEEIDAKIQEVKTLIATANETLQELENSLGTYATKEELNKKANVSDIPSTDSFITKNGFRIGTIKTNVLIGYGVGLSSIDGPIVGAYSPSNQYYLVPMNKYDADTRKWSFRCLGFDTSTGDIFFGTAKTISDAILYYLDLEGIDNK